MATVDLPTYHLWDQECSKIFLNQVQCARSHICCPLFPWACLKHLGEGSCALGSAFRNAPEHSILLWCGCCWYLQHCISFSGNSLKSRRFTSTVFLEMLNSPNLPPPMQSSVSYIYTLIEQILVTCILCAKHRAEHWASSDDLTVWSLLSVVCKAGKGHLGGRARGELSNAPWG